MSFRRARRAVPLQILSLRSHLPPDRQIERIREECV